MQLAKTEISLTLTNKFEVPDSDDSDKNHLLLRYVNRVLACWKLDIERYKQHGSSADYS